MDKNSFFYPRSRYYGVMKPENLIFNANLQEFSQRIDIICSLETSGKITNLEAYEQIKELWNQLKHSKKELKIDQNPPSGIS